MSNTQCFLCGTSFTEIGGPIPPSTDACSAHIFPAAIGGRKKTRVFACIGCDNGSGFKEDAVLAEQLKTLTHQLNIKRQRGETPPLQVTTPSGKTYFLKAEGGGVPGKPTSHVDPLSDGRMKLDISARSPEEALKLLKGYKRKYPKLDLKEAMKSFQTRSTYIDEPVLLSFEWLEGEALRSVVKTALSWAAENGLLPDQCRNALDWVYDSGRQTCWAHFYHLDVIQGRNSGVPFHGVSLQGECDGPLLAYIEYFGAYRFLVKLSDDYQGPRLSSTYAIDPCTGTEIAINVGELNWPPPTYERDAHKIQVQQALLAVFGDASARAKEREEERVRNEAKTFAIQRFKETNPGIALESLPLAEQSQMLEPAIHEKLKPWFEHQEHNPFTKEILKRYPPADPRLGAP